MSDSVLYSEVIISKAKRKNKEVSPSQETTYSELKDLKTPRVTEQLVVSQPVQPNGRSKVTAEKVSLAALGGLLTVVVAALCYVSYDNIQNKAALQNLKDQHEATMTNLSARISLLTKLPLASCSRCQQTQGSNCFTCNEPWVLYENSCYYFNTLEHNWDNSRKVCKSRGGDLVKIDSMGEQMFLEQSLRERMTKPEDKFWIGLTDSAKEGQWLWVDGSPLRESVSFWSAGEPDNWKGESNFGENCVRMGEKFGSLDLHCWFDKDCFKTHKGICEKQAKTGKTLCNTLSHG